MSNEQSLARVVFPDHCTISIPQLTIWVLCLINTGYWLILTFTWWKSVPVPSPICLTRDCDPCSITVVRHAELVPQLCTSVAGQHLNQEGIYFLLTELELQSPHWCRPSRIFPHLASRTNPPTQLSDIVHLKN